MSERDAVAFTGPEMKVYLALCDRAVDQLTAGLDEALAHEWKTLAIRSTGQVREALQRAYMSGVRDGFVQGVQAQCDAEDASP